MCRARRCRSSGRCGSAIRGRDDDEFARHAVAALVAPRVDRVEIAPADAFPHAVVEARPRERDRAADERRGARRVGVGVIERRGNAMLLDRPEAAGPRTGASACRARPGRRRAGTRRLRPRRRRSRRARDQPHRDRSPHTATTTRPPGRSTRRISRIACAGSGMYMRPSAHSATSKLASGSPAARRPCARTWRSRGPVPPRAVARHRPCDRTGRRRRRCRRRRRPRLPPTRRARCRRPRRARARRARARRAPAAPACAQRELRMPQRLVRGCRQVPAVALDPSLQPRLHRQRRVTTISRYSLGHDERARAAASSCWSADRSGRAPAPWPCPPAARRRPCAPGRTTCGRPR